MGIFSRIFGRSSASEKGRGGDGEYSATEIALMALTQKNEAAFLDGMSRGLPIDVNDMRAGAPMLSMALAHDLDRAAAAILEKGADVSLRDVHVGMTPLVIASTKGKLEFVRRLLAAGADPNVEFGPPEGPRWTCLARAVHSGDRELVRMLLKGGAKPDCDLRPDAAEEEDRGVTPLTYAACVGDLEMMRLMIDHGANVNYWPRSTISPLMQACMNGQTEAAKLLVEKGAVIELASKKLNTHAFELALHQGHRELAGWLWERSKILQSGYGREVWAG